MTWLTRTGARIGLEMFPTVAALRSTVNHGFTRVPFFWIFVTQRANSTLEVGRSLISRRPNLG